MTGPIDPREALVHVFHGGVALSFLRASTHSSSIYGGPLELHVQGRPLAQPVHHVATIAGEHLRLAGITGFDRDLPLVYGFSYSDCRLDYAFDVSTIDLVSLEPGQPTADWPYAGYPRLLPYVPLEPGPVVPSTWGGFLRLSPNLPERQPAEWVVLVPPPATLGYSMWGPSGDREEATVVFEFSPRERRVRSYNVCS